MRTQIAKTEYLPAEYIPLAFLTRTPPPFAQVDGGGCYREKFFLIFIFLIFARNLRMSGLRIFFYFFRDFVPIRIHTRFYSEYLSF